MIPDLGLLFRGQLYLGRLGLDRLRGLWLRLGLGERAALNRSTSGAKQGSQCAQIDPLQQGIHFWRAARMVLVPQR